MNKQYVRSYRIADDGDLEVFSLKGSKPVDLSSHYEEIPRDRHLLSPGAFVDVFRLSNGELTWNGSANGHEAGCALSMKLLLEAFTQDLLQDESKPRGS